MTSRAVIICGDRHWEDRRTIRDYVKSLPSDTRVITGGARGADRIAESYRRTYGLDGKVYDAKWHMFGRAAGPIRNRTMLKEENPYLVVAFHDNISRSRGTRDMLLKARKKGIRHELRKSDGSVDNKPRI